MATLLPPPPTGAAVRILDPGAGGGILGVAAALHALSVGASTVEVTAVEAEPSAIDALATTAEALSHATDGRGRIKIVAADFLKACTPRLGVEPLAGQFDAVIANPPYFKLSPSDPSGGTAPNAYARFMETSARLLRPSGVMVFIVPRSFTSGLYFKGFRATLRTIVALNRVHLFESRRDTFSDDDVLQENVITVHHKALPALGDVQISSSTGIADLDSAAPIDVSRSVVEDVDQSGNPQPEAPIRLPATPAEAAIVRRVKKWPENLSSLGLKISTGPVVPFRTDALRQAAEFDSSGHALTVPLLWMQHVRTGGVSWPIDGFRKPQHLQAGADPKLLVSNQTMILLRRFSTKDESQRLVAALYLRNTFPSSMLGLENHVNYIHSPSGSTPEAVLAGLAALLASPLADSYFRVANGNTQVNATDLQSFPLPSAQSLTRLGRFALTAPTGWWTDGGAIQQAIDTIAPEQTTAST
jgi:adenine-specific DNA-methyltransferase